MGQGRSSHKPEIAIAYWGASGVNPPRGWDFRHRNSVPRICPHCDDIADSWRGRFENAQITMRMCASEGRGFKDCIQNFMMLSTEDSVDTNLHTFYRWCSEQK